MCKRSMWRRVMPEESATPDLVELTRQVFEAVQVVGFGALAMPTPLREVTA